MTTKKQKPLTILGAPLRKTNYGATAKTKLGVVYVSVADGLFVGKVYASIILTADGLFVGKVYVSIILTNDTYTYLPRFHAPLDQRTCDMISSQLRAIHRACQVKL